MRRFSRALTLVAGAALAIGSTGAAVGQEDPPPEGTEVAEDPAAEVVVEPSKLDIIQVAGHKAANKPLRGKKLKQAVAKAVPAPAQYYVNGMGADPIERIVEMSLQARSLGEAGDTEAAKATLALATLLYRNAWSRAKTDPDTINRAIEEFIAAGDYPEQDPALALWSFGDEGLIGFVDICFGPGGIQWIGSQEDLSSCEDVKGRQVRADFSLINESKNSTKNLYSGDLKTADIGGIGIHKIVQDKTANDKLAGKKFKKAWTKALQKHGPPTVSLHTGGPDASAEQQVIELVLAAREADEAGNAKAAKGFMDLALATYRSTVPKPAEGTINTEALNSSIAGLILTDYADVPGLGMTTPPDMVSVCYSPKESKCYQNAGDHTPWECAQVGTVFTRMTRDEALAAKCPEVE